MQDFIDIIVLDEGFGFVVMWLTEVSGLAAVDFGGTSTIAPGVIGMTNGVAVKVLSKEGSRVRARSPWDLPPKLD